MAVVLAVGFILPPFVQLGLGLVAYLLALLPTRSLEWSDLGGLFHGDRPAAEVTFGNGDDRGPIGTWRSLQGADGATLRAADGAAVPRWAPVAARLAGCDPVTVDGGGTAPRWWRWFVSPTPAPGPDDMPVERPRTAVGQP
jgi:hypothetical protein